MSVPKPLYKQLTEYLISNNLNGKEIAEIFRYSPAAISQYLNGKSTDSKLDVIVDLFLKLKAFENSGLTLSEKEELEASNEILRLKCARYEGEILALKSIMKDMQSKSILDNAEIRKAVEIAMSEFMTKPK